MKFILNEELTLDEKFYPSEQRDLINIMTQKGYSKQDISDTLEMIDKDETQEKQYRDIIQRYNGTKTTSNNDQNQSQSNQQSDSQDSSQDSQNDSNEEPNDQQNDQQPVNTKDKLVSYFSETEPKAFEEFKKGIGNHINDNNFPFVKLMSMPRFAKAIGVNVEESLNEAGPISNLVSKTLGNKIANVMKTNQDKKSSQRWNNAKNTASISKFVRAYNALLKIDENVANTYLNKAKEKSILCDPNLYTIDAKQIPKALNIDVAGWTATNIPEKDRKKILVDLKSAVFNNKVDQLSSYDINGSKNDDNELLNKALKVLKTNSKAKDAFIKELSNGS